MALAPSLRPTASAVSLLCAFEDVGELACAFVRCAVQLRKVGVIPGSEEMQASWRKLQAALVRTMELECDWC